MSITYSHRLILPIDSNHYGTLYAGSLLRIALEAGYATAWKHVGPHANLVLRRVLNLECDRPVPIGTVIEIRGAVLHRTQAYLITGLIGAPLQAEQPPWMEALLGFVQVDESGRPQPFPNNLPDIDLPESADNWPQMIERMQKLLRIR
jgi:acyl-CoA thioesterase YciA